MAADDNQGNKIDKLISSVKNAAQSTDAETMMKQVDKLKTSEKQVKDKKKQVAKNPKGLDIGTSRIVCAQQQEDGEIILKDQLNAFLKVKYSTFAKEMLDKNEISHTINDDEIVVYGYDSQEFANIFNAEVQRPMKRGVLQWEEENAINIIKRIIPLVTGRPQLGDTICFGIPAAKIGEENELVFHEAVLKKFLIGMGFKASSITEGMAVVLSELAEDNYTGIGISMGAGMVNVCFSFLSVPVITFSISKGGDDIDANVARVVNETHNRIRVIKEEEFDFGKPARNNMENAFHIFYEELLASVFQNLNLVMSKSESMPKLKRPIPIVFSGGTTMPKNFRSFVEKQFKEFKLPIEISEIRLASDQLRATARGALINAVAM